MEVLEETEYPFRGRVRFTVKPETAARFALTVRIPGWAGAGTKIRVNGESWIGARENGWARMERTWKAGDRVELDFPMEPRVSRGFHNSAAVERGPLVFSYGIGEDWVKLRERGMTADWQVFPRTAWNYALALDEGDPAKGIEVAESEIGAVPFGRDHAPVRLTVRARRLDEWRAEDGVANSLPESPVKSSVAEEKITLVPYAAAKLRITAFPVLGG